MIVGAAFCPHPPVLVPEVASGAAGELDGLRAACDEAVGELVAARPEVVVVLGSGPAAATYPQDAAGSFSGFGVDVRVGGPGEPVLPLSLTVGAWLLDRAGWTGPRRYLAAPSSPRLRSSRERFGGSGGPERSLLDRRARGADAEADAEPRRALLVMGDGSACRDEKAPGAFDPRAAGYDAAVARALAVGDVAALRALAADPLAADLMVAGAAAWAASTDLLADVRVEQARLLADEAPYGVGYVVATWTTDAGA